MCTKIRTARVFFSAGKYSVCSGRAVCEYGTCVCSLMPRLSALCLQVSDLLQLHQTNSFPTSDQKSITLCFSPTLNIAQIFAMICILSLTDFCSKSLLLYFCIFFNIPVGPIYIMSCISFSGQPNWVCVQLVGEV